MVEDKEKTVAKCREVVSRGQTAFGGVQTNTYTLATPSECVSAKKCAEGVRGHEGDSRERKIQHVFLRPLGLLLEYQYVV